jgi:hypothetical protein
MGALRRQTAFSIGALVCAAVGGTDAISRAMEIRVILQNDGVAPADVVARSQSEVTDLFRSIDVEVTWVNEPVDETRGVRVVKITNWEPPNRAVGTAALGVTYTGEHGTKRAYVIWPRVQRLAQRASVRLDSLLAVAIAHEMGHMVLPEGSHAKRGVMRETWDANDLRSASAGLLKFSRESAVMIAHGLRPAAAVAGRK